MHSQGRVKTLLTLFPIRCNGLAFNDGEIHFDSMTFQHSREGFQALKEQQQQFGGGSTPKPPKQEKISFPEAPPISIPSPPPAPAAPPPPPTTSNLDSQQASQDQKQQAARRKGIRSTLIAGESSGSLTPKAAGQKTLLGG